MKNNNKLECFISYSHLDKKYKNNMIKALAQISSEYNLSTWHDCEILAGGSIDDSIRDRLEKANIIILLLTTNFLTSYYCMEIEMKSAIERMQKKECVVVPVYCEDCIIRKDSVLSDLRRVPEERAICDYRPHIKGCNNAVELISKMIGDTFFEKKKEKRTVSNKQQEITDESPYIELYKSGKKAKIKVDKTFLDVTPKLSIHYTQFVSKMSLLTKKSIETYVDTIKETSSETKLEYQYKLLRLFLMDVCAYIKTYITGPGGIRVHFRGVSNDYYIGIIAVSCEEKDKDLQTDWTSALTPIPYGKGLIYYSGENQATLLKSLNARLAYKGKNDKKWKEYLTHAFINLNEGQSPVLSLGISMEAECYNDKNKALFYYLAHMKFGECVEYFIKNYCNECKKNDKSYDLEMILKKNIKMCS